jgi:hypothetical protein
MMLEKMLGLPGSGKINNALIDKLQDSGAAIGFDPQSGSFGKGHFGMQGGLNSMSLLTPGGAEARPALAAEKMVPELLSTAEKVVPELISAARRIAPKAEQLQGVVNSRLLDKLAAFKGYVSRGGKMNLARWHRGTIQHYGGEGGVYNSGFSKWFRQTGGKLNGNSLLATGPHDVYAILGLHTGRILHFGETGRGYLTRFNEHLRTFAKLGIQIRVEPLGTVEGKAAAKALELRYIETYTRFFGERPLFNPVNH